MHWKTKLTLKYAAQKVLGIHPYLALLQERVKLYRNHWQNHLTEDFLLTRARRQVTHMARCGIKPPKRVLEQGSGWHGLDPIFFYLAGAEEIISYDTMPWFREALFRMVLGHGPALAKIVTTWPGVDKDQALSRGQSVRDLNQLAFEQVLSTMGLTFRVSRTMTHPDLHADSFDLIYSNSVLQRLVDKDLHSLSREAYRLLKPGGHTFHTIDCKDFQAIYDARIPQLDYLKWSESAWRLITSTYLNYQNRKRLPEFKALFHEAGFSVSTSNELLLPTNLEFVKHMTIQPRFAAYPPEQLAITGFDLLGTKPANDRGDTSITQKRMNNLSS